MVKKHISESLKLSRIVHLTSIVLALMFVAIFFSSLDIEGANSGEDCNLTDTAFFNYTVLRMMGDTTIICNFFGERIKRLTQGGYSFYLVNDFYYDKMTGIPTVTYRNVFFNCK